MKPLPNQAIFPAMAPDMLEDRSSRIRQAALDALRPGRDSTLCDLVNSLAVSRISPMVKYEEVYEQLLMLLQTGQASSWRAGPGLTAYRKGGGA